MSRKLRVVILKPSKYGIDGDVERFRRGFMPNSTVPFIRSMTPSSIDDCEIETHVIDEYVQTKLDYLDLLRRSDHPTLLTLVGVQSNQFQRALDLAALGRSNGVEHCVIGGPHPMTCDTRMLQGHGIAFALAEAELIWPTILRDAIAGELAPAYGESQRWQAILETPALIPPSRRDLKRYVAPMLGLYPARGCPFTCNFCSVIKIAGRQIRGQAIDVTLASLQAAKAAGVKIIMFTSDNFNKYPDAEQLMEAMIDARIELPFFIQCDTQIAKQEAFVAKLARAGCFQMFVGVESFSRKVLLAVHKTQNYPGTYGEIVRLCRKYGITSHFSNIIGFPEDTEASILEHVQTLRALNPDASSFYILTPGPGTEQYDNFRAAGWITEKNLDRFDGTCPTWNHPTLDYRQLNDLLFRCYREFYNIPHIVRASLQMFSRHYAHVGAQMSLGFQVFNRYSAMMRLHPMSGGVGRVRRDSDRDYRELRKRQFGFDLIPLPESLGLSTADTALNARVRL